MSKRRRRDELTGRLTESQRRKRRSLDALTFTDTGLTVSTGGAGSTCGCPSTCPEEGVNFGPADARLEWYTAQSTGTVIGHIYEDVNLESMGFVPGDDVISYCYSARIGPSTGPIELFCDGKLARIERGLVATIMPQEAGFFSSSTGIGYWGSTAVWGDSTNSAYDYAVRTDTDTGKRVLYLADQQGGSCAGPWAYVAAKIDALTGTDKALVQMSYNRSGVCSNVNLVSDPSNISCWWDNNDGREPERGGTRGGASLGGTGWAVSRGGGLFVTKHFLIGPGGSNQYGTGNPISMAYDASTAPTPYFGPRSWVTTLYNRSLILGGNDPLINGNAWGGDEDTLFFMNTLTGLGALTPTTNCGGITDEGWTSFYDIYVMRDEKVKWRLNSSGRVATLGSGGQKTAFAASTDETTWSHNIWRGSTAWDSFFPSSAPLNGDWGAPYPQKGVKIYNTSTLGTPILNCTEPWIWGGDVFAYSSGGFAISTGGSTCCATHVKLNFLDVDGTVLSTYGSTGGTNKYAEQRVTGIENLLIPANAATARFTQVKTGSCDCFGWADDLMFSEGPCCIHYSPPIIVAIRDYGAAVVTSTDGGVIGVSTEITGVWSASNSTFISGDEIYDAVQEHSRVNLNVLAEGHDEVCVTAATGDVVGTPYPDVTLAELGMSTADTLSFRWKVKVST